VTGPKPHGAEAGFTLVELLVVITLVGLISVALFGGLRFGIRVWEVGAYRSDRLSEIEVAQSLLRRLLLRTVLTADDEGNLTFEGDEQGLLFTAPAPAQFGLGGIYLFEIFTERVEEGEDLILRWQLFRADDQDELFGENSESRVLVEGIEGMSIRYFGVPDGSSRRADPDWESEWKDAEILPEMVGIAIAFDREDDRIWPELNVTPMSRTDNLLE